MHSDGFLFLSGGSGGGTVFVSVLEMVPRTPASDRARSRCARCAVPVGLACVGTVWWQCHLAVPWGLLVGVSRVWRCGVWIAGGGVVWGALCRCVLRGGRAMGSACRWDWRGGRGVGSVVPLGVRTERS